MTSENKRWDHLKAQYLHKVEKALSSVKHPRRKEVLEDVRTHLERRFAELKPDEQTSENLQTIITEMGPASDYAELLDAHTIVTARSALPKYGLWLGLGAIIVITAILLPLMRTSEKVGYIVTFEAFAPFAPRTAGELLAAFNENHPRNVRTHHYRSSIRGDRLQGHIVIDTERARRAIIEMINENSQLILVKTRPVTRKDLETHNTLGQPSLSQDKGSGDDGKKRTGQTRAQGIEMKQTNVDSKAGDNNQDRRSRLRSPSSSNETVSRSGSWPGGDCFFYGHVYRVARYGRIGHAKVCLSSEQFGSWTIEAGDHGQFDFKNIPAGIYMLQTVETFGYRDTYYNPESKTSDRPTFRLSEGERKSASIEIKPIRPYRRIAGKILDEDGMPIMNSKGFMVYAWAQRPQGRWKGHYQRISSSRVNEDGSYLLDELDARPVYVQVLDRDAPNRDNPNPPRFFPGTFSRTEAKLITFEDKEMVENVDISIKRKGGLVLEGLVTDDSNGAPVPEAMVSIFHFDMFFDLYCSYTDEQGRYRMEGLGKGTFIVHVDAVHKEFVKTRKIVTIKPNTKETQLDFTLRRGVKVSGRFVDDKGDPWPVGRNFGGAYIEGRPGGAASNFVYGNKYAPAYIREGCTIFSEQSQGDHPNTKMVFPTNSTFLLPAMMPGKMFFRFRPRGKNERLLKILYQGKDVLRTGLVIKSGQKIENVTIVVGTDIRT